MWMEKDRKNPPRYSPQYSPRYSPRYSPGYSPPGWAARSGPSHSTPFCAPMESREPGTQDHTISKWPQNRVGVVTPTPHVGAKSGGSCYSHLELAPTSSGSGHSHFACGPKVEWEWSVPLRTGPKVEWEWSLPLRSGTKVGWCLLRTGPKVEREIVFLLSY